MSAAIDKTIKIVDGKGKVLAELQKIVKDVTVEEFKKMLVGFKPFRKWKVLFHKLTSMHLTLSDNNKLIINNI